MSELEALSNTPSIVETRMMETSETVATDGECIGSPSSHSHGSLATPEASETFSGAGTAAGSGIGKLSTPSPRTRQNVKGERLRINHTIVLFLQGVAVLCAFLLPLPDAMLTGVDCEAPPPTTLSETEVMALTLIFLFADPNGAEPKQPGRLGQPAAIVSGS